MSRAEGVIVHKRMSFLSSLVWGVSSVLIVVLLCAAGIIFYAMTIFDSRVSGVVELLDGALEDLPDFAGSVPVLADALSNERRPEYLHDLDVSITFSKHPHYEDRMMPVVTVANKGKEQVVWMHMRVVVRDGAGNILDEQGQYIATPIPFDEHDAPGPLMPGEKRFLTAGSFQAVDDPVAEHEITDIRVWVKPADEPAARVTRQIGTPVASR